MAAQRRIDLVLDSVKRLLRIGATANLLNLLQKQHPADLAQVFSELQNKDREAAFSILADRNGRLAMEAISELGPEKLPCALVRGHAPFTWGTSLAKAVEVSVILEEVARMAFLTATLNPSAPSLDAAVRNKHYERKHGPNAYYGQR